MADRVLFGAAATSSPEIERPTAPEASGIPLPEEGLPFRQPEESGGALPENVIPLPTADEQTAPAETEQTVTVTAPPPDSAGGAGLSGVSWPGSPWLSIVLGVCVLGSLACNIALLRRRKRRLAPGVRIGRVHAQGARQYQQDCLAVSDPDKAGSRGLLAVVADGMGGLSDGDKLSAAAVEAALSAFTGSAGTEPPEQLLLTLAQRAVRAVNELLGPNDLRKGGTTLLLGLVRNGRFYYFSVGDSHIYLLRQGGLVLLNREHVFTGELALRCVNGETSAPEVYNNSQGGGLVSYLGMGALKYADFPAEPVQIVPGDKFILMSDGVYNALEPGELRDLLDGAPEKAASRLGQAIAAKGYANQDNYTAVILECGPEA